MPSIKRLHSGLISILDYRCTATAHDIPFTEMHESHSLSFVRKGSFGCKYGGNHFELIQGSIFVGHTGDEYVCTHDHHNGGDECLSFQLSPELVDLLCSHKKTWQIGSISPLPELMIFGELAQSCIKGKCDLGIDEIGILFVKRFTDIASGRKEKSTRIRAQDRKRAVSCALWLNEHSSEPITLESAARVANLTPFHFLRIFNKVHGVTPHQYLVRLRLQNAARLLAEDDKKITEIALDVGFSDISNFTRTFHRTAGVSPTNFRMAAKGLYAI